MSTNTAFSKALTDTVDRTVQSAYNDLRIACAAITGTGHELAGPLDKLLFKAKTGEHNTPEWTMTAAPIARSLAATFKGDKERMEMRIPCSYLNVVRTERPQGHFPLERLEMTGETFAARLRADADKLALASAFRLALRNAQQNPEPV